MQELINWVLEEVRGAWRFRRYALITTWIICLVGWVVVLFIPDKYEANARVFVDPTTALRPALQGLAIEQDVNAELNLVRQSLLGEPELRKVAETTGLMRGAASASQKAGVVSGLRNRLTITVQSGGQGNPNDGQVAPSRLYTIAYQDSNRERALEIVTSLLNTFVEGTLGGKREGSQQTQKFLEDQIKDYEQRLGQAEQSLADFKKQNVGLMPGEQGGDYFSRLQGEMDAVKTSQTQLNAALTRRDALQRQLRGEAPIAASAGLGGSAGGAQTGGDTLTRMKEVEARLDEMLLRYTDKHPDVVALRQTLADLKKRRESELEGLRRGDPRAAAATGASSNPVYQSIQLALNQAEIEVATVRGQLSGHQQSIAELKKMVDTIPQVEAEYSRLNRDYSVTRAQYTALVERLERARLTEGAEASGSVRFSVIDPPAAGFQPVSSSRPVMLLGVLVAGIAAGIGLAYLLNLLKPIFSSERTLAEVTGLPVLGAISLSRSAFAQTQLWAAYVRYAWCSGLLLVLFVAVVIIGRLFAPLGASA